MSERTLEIVETLKRLRSKLAHAKKNNLRASALFLSETIVSLQQSETALARRRRRRRGRTGEHGDAEEEDATAMAALDADVVTNNADVHEFAKILHDDGQHVRALETLNKYYCSDSSREFNETTVLRAKCLLKARLFEECLQVCASDGLGCDFEDRANTSRNKTSKGLFSSDIDSSNHNNNNKQYKQIVHHERFNDGLDELRAVSALVRAKVHVQLDSRQVASRWFQISLRMDPMLFDSYEALTKSHALAPDSEREFVKSLEFEREDEWMRAVYDAIALRFEDCDFGYVLRDSTNNFGSNIDDNSNNATTTATVATNSPSRRSPRKKQSTTNTTQTTTIPTTTAAMTTTSVQIELLRNAPFLRAKRAEWLYNRGETRKCYDEMQKIASKTSSASRYDVESLPAYLAAAVDLKKSNDLYKIAHDLTALYPKHAISWYAVGCYYLVAKRFDDARRYFGKATVADQAFAPAWIAFGHAFAMQDESDQAVAAYRTASRLFPGMHVPVLCAGMEYSRGSNNASFAQSFFEKAAELNPTDALVKNELGVSAYKRKEYLEAEQFLRDALWLATRSGSTNEMHPTTTTTSPTKYHSEENDVVALASRLSSQKLERWEPCVVNLAHCLRKLNRFEESIACYEQAIALRPNISSTHSALGFTYQRKANFLDRASLENAVASYHKALGLNPSCEFSQEMLQLCLVDLCACSLPTYTQEEYDTNPIDLREDDENEKAFYSDAYEQEEDAYMEG